MESPRFRLRRTLIIGLGGTGRHVCTRLKRIFLEGSDHDPARFSHVRLLSIDTDARLREVMSSAVSPAQLDPTEVHGLRLPAALDRQRFSKFIGETVTRHLPHANDQGAMRSRPVGHAFLVANWSRTRERIKRLIQELSRADLRNEVRTDARFRGLSLDSAKLDIYVVGNLVSGTGSGMALGMGYLLRDLTHELFDGKTEYRTEGVFTVCGVYAHSDVGGMPSPYAVNCYASLLELNHFSNPDVHRNRCSAYDPGFDEVQLHQNARMRPPYDNVQLLNPSHSAAGDLSHEELEPHIAEVLALRTGSAIGMTGNAKVVDELIARNPYDSKGNLRFCWAWGAHSFRSSRQEIFDLATALTAERVIAALTGEHVREGINRKELAWEILSSLGFGYAADTSNASFLTALLTPNDPIDDGPTDVSLVDTIRSLVTRAFPQPRNSKELFEGLSIQLDRRKAELSARITGLISSVLSHNRRVQALNVREAFEKEIDRLADFSLDGRGSLDAAIEIIDALVGSPDGNGLLIKESEAYQTAAQSTIAEIDRGVSYAATHEDAIKAIAAMGRRFDYQTLVGAWSSFVESTIHAKTMEARSAVLQEACKILKGDATNDNEALRSGLIQYLEQRRSRLKAARQQLNNLERRFETEIDRLKRLCKQPDMGESEVLKEAHDVRNKTLEGEHLRNCAAQLTKLLGPPYVAATRYEIRGQMDKDYGVIDREMREHIHRIAAIFTATSIEANPTFDGRLQTLLERAEPALRLNPDTDKPPEIAYISIPPDVPSFKEEVKRSQWLAERSIKNKDDEELFQQRVGDVEPRVDVIVARLNFSPASIIGIDKWAELYGRAAVSAEGRRSVHTIPDSTGGENLFFEDLVSTTNRVVVAYFIARTQGWLRESAGETIYEYPRPENIIFTAHRCKLDSSLGDLEILDDLKTPVEANAIDPTLREPKFVHAMRRFRSLVLEGDSEKREEALNRLSIGVIQLVNWTGELGCDQLLLNQLRGSTSSLEKEFAQVLAPLGMFQDLLRRVRNLERSQQRVPRLGEIAALKDVPNGAGVPARRVFVSYSHEDNALRKELVKHLSALQREGQILTWYDRRIAAGEEWRGQIDEQLEAADVILLLVSASFIASEYCWDVETTRALERHALGEAKVIPVIVRPCDWQNGPLAGLQALPQDGKPVIGWPRPDEAWLDVVRGLRFTFGVLGGEPDPAVGKTVVDASSNERASPEWHGLKPRYADEESRHLSLQLKTLFQRRKKLTIAGSDTRGVEGQILDLRRQLRKGPQLRAGEFLGDGRYELLEIVGRGGFATVWKAWDGEDAQLVALKVLHGHYADDRGMCERFLRGARKMAELVPKQARLDLACPIQPEWLRSQHFYRLTFALVSLIDR